jgi:hypothetical protein
MLDDGQLFGERRHALDAWPVVLFAVHLFHALLFSRLYPEHRFDPDILSYFVYFRSWLESDSVLHGAAFFNQPKPLLVFGLGPLGDVTWAFYCTAVVSALLGSVVYLVGRDAFGSSAGILWSLLLLLDPQKGFLTLKSSADLYLALFLFLAILLSLSARWRAASLCILLAALVKPVSIPCALYFLTVPGRRRQRWLCTLVPLLALPLTLLANQVLLGSSLDPGRYLGEFAALREGESINPAELVHFALWTQLVKTRFVSTAPLGVLGVFIWMARDRRRLTSPLLLMPLLFLGGYLGLAVVTPYMPFFRFFWPLEVWFLGFLTFGIVEVARRLATGHRWAQATAMGLLLIFVADDSLERHLSYRDHFALPMEANMAFVNSSRVMLQNQRLTGEHVLVPLAFQPYLMWALDTRSPNDIATAEQAALHAMGGRPEWILHVPSGYVSQRARELVDALIRDGGYEVRLSDEQGSLLALPTAGRSHPLAKAG